MKKTCEIAVTVNGTVYEAAVEPRLLLADFLRDTLGLTGTHVGCEHGVCGACTVLVDGDSARSCLMLAVQANGRREMTEVTCSSCSKPTQVPFKPTEGRPVYCSDCYTRERLTSRSTSWR